MGADYLSYKDREIPESSPWPYWETCMTLNHSWGYVEKDDAWKDSKKVIQQLVEVTSKGGTFLLNIGPKGDGEIPAESIRILLEAGEWLKINGESIYGAQPTPLKGVGALDPASLKRLQEQEESAKKTGAKSKKKIMPEMSYEWLATGQDGKIYIHLFKWPEGQFVIPEFGDTVSKAYLLDAREKEVTFNQEDGALSVNLPDAPSSEIATVLCLEIQK